MNPDNIVMSPVDGQRLTTLSKRKEGLKFDAIRL